MELKIDEKQLEEIRTKSAKEMDLFEGKQLRMPLVKLDPKQFKWPKTFLVQSAQRVDAKVIDYETGWNKKDDQGNYLTTGKHNVQLILSNGDVAQTLANAGKNFRDLPIVPCLVKKDIPLEKLEDGLTLIKLVKPVVMLGMTWNHGVKWDHIKLVCEDVEF